MSLRGARVTTATRHCFDPNAFCAFRILFFFLCFVLSLISYSLLHRYSPSTPFISCFASHSLSLSIVISVLLLHVQCAFCTDVRLLRFIRPNRAYSHIQFIFLSQSFFFCSSCMRVQRTPWVARSLTHSLARLLPKHTKNRQTIKHTHIQRHTGAWSM